MASLIIVLGYGEWLCHPHPRKFDWATLLKRAAYLMVIIVLIAKDF
jgi:hypothetical protein